MKLTESQARAVNSDSLLILVIAGAGSGKTRALVLRIQRLIESGVSPKEIVAITFTNAAADEMRKRLDHWRPGTGDSLGYIGTVHGYMLKILREYGKTVGLGSVLTVIDEQERTHRIDTTIEEMAFTGSYESVIDSIKLGPFKLGEVAVRSKAQDVARAYFNKMIQTCSMDFDMILHYGARLASIVWANSLPAPGANPNQPNIIGEAKYLFVDEFQDSSDHEATFYALAKFKQKFFVGDPDQAIYSFRGGNIQNILQLARTDAAETIMLLENFRSDFEIVNTSNRLIGNNKNRVQKTCLCASSEPGESKFVPLSDDMAESAWIATDIRKHRGYPQVPIVEYSVAVLCRTNPIARAIAARLESHGIQVSKKGLIRRPADWRLTKQAINFLANPDDDNLAFHILSAAYGHAQADARRCSAHSRLITINQAEGFCDYETPVDAVTTFLARRLNIGAESRQLVSDAVSLLPHDATIGDLSLALAREEMRDSQPSEGITVATIHAAKGREWDHVYLPAWEEGTLPSNSADVEEERRLAYVAITRARHRCLIFTTQNRIFEYGPRMGTPQKPSLFLSDLGLV